LFIIILTVTSASTTALEINFNSPGSVELNEEFVVTIKADSEETHDVKIFVHNSKDEKIKSEEYISEIYNEGWKNPWYYLKEFYPGNKEYEIRAIESPGEREICVRLRKSGSSNFYTECKSIEILNKVSDERVAAPVEESVPEHNEEIINKEEKEIQPLSSPTDLTQTTLAQNKETQQTKSITTKPSKIRRAIIYSFIFLLSVITILLALRRL